MEGLGLYIDWILRGLIIWAIVSSGFKVDRDGLLVEYGWLVKLAVLAMSGISLLLINSASQAEKGPNAFVYAILLSMAVISLIGVFEVFRRKLWLDHEEIHYQSPYRRRMSFKINEIVQCRSSDNSRTYRFIASEGQVIEISQYMSGADRFFALIKDRLTRGGL